MLSETNIITHEAPPIAPPAAVPATHLPEAGTAEVELSESKRASMMLRVFGNERLSFFESERAAFYLNILYKMLLLRREHELQPLHEDLYYAVRDQQLLFSSDYDLNQFAADVAQLLEWGNLTKVLEPYRLRSYKDHSRENFRYVLNENTVEFLQWLEHRVRARAEGRGRDGRNFLQDIVAALQELDRLCASAQTQEAAAPEETARRALHLMYSIEDHIHDLSSELLEFRAAMVQFVTRAYDLETLKAILHWLGRYVEVYLQGIYALRERILGLVVKLDNAATRNFLDGCHEIMAEQRRRMPQALRGEVAAEPLRAERFLRHVDEFLSREARLDELCERINGTAREVIKKMDAKLRELERRNTRIHDLKARIRELASAPASDIHAQARQGETFNRNGDEARLAGYHFINALLLPSFAILDAQHWDAHSKAVPPRPRKYPSSSSSAVPKRYLKAKARTRQELYELEEKKREELRRWIEEILLKGHPQIRLAERRLDDPRAAQLWMKLMHYAYVTPAKDLPALKIKLAKLIESPASVLLGSASEGLYTPDHLVIDSSRSS
jgi:hypothetical protein